MELIRDLYEQGVTNTTAIMKAYMERGPVRVTFRKNVCHRVGGFPSKKVGKYVIYYSPNEMNAMFWLEFRNDVVCFMEQPMEIEWIDGCVYTPDLLILFRDGRLEVWDPKGEFFYDDEFKQKESFVKEKLGAFGIRFEVMTEDKLPSGDFLENLRLMLQHRTYLADERVALLTRWPSQDFLTVDQLCSGILGEPLKYGEIINLFGRGHLSLNPYEPINDDTLVSLGNVPVAC